MFLLALPLACVVAQLLLAGEGVPRDATAGMAWVAKAAGQGYALQQREVVLELLRDRGWDWMPALREVQEVQRDAKPNLVEHAIPI